MIEQLATFLGAPTETIELSKNPLPRSPIKKLRIGYFAPQGPSSRVVLATSGAHKYRMQNGRRIEAMMVLRKEPAGPAFDAARKLLSTFVLMPEAKRRSIRHGDIIRADLSGFCLMDALLVVPPLLFPRKLHRAKLANDTVDNLWLVPVFESEAKYALAHGAQALMMLFAAQGLDLTDPQRAEANTHVDPSDLQSMAKKAIQGRLKNRRTKTARKLGKGSFDVQVEQKAGAAIRISRRRAHS
jgi:hypothetical protein